MATGMVQRRGHGGPTKQPYPWEDWIARGTVTLLRGRDYRCTPFSLSQLAQWAAGKRGYKVSRRIAKDKQSITLTFTLMGEE